MFESCRITLQWESRSDQWLFQVAGRCFPVHANWLTDFPAEVLNELSSACSSSCPSGPEPLLPIRKQLFPGFDPARNNVHVIPMLLRWIMSKGAQGSGTVLVFLLGREAIDAADAELRSHSDLWGRTKNVRAARVEQKSVDAATLWLPLRHPRANDGLVCNLGSQRSKSALTRSAISNMECFCQHHLRLCLNP